MTWLWLLLALVVVGQVKPGGSGDDEGSGDSDKENSPDQNLQGNSRGRNERRTLTAEHWVRGKKWADHIGDDTKTLLTEFGAVITKKEKKQLKRKMNGLQNEVNHQTLESIQETLKEVKGRADKNGARSTPNSQQMITRITSGTQVFIDKGPILKKNIEDGDGWAATATVCSMIQGVTALIPHPIGLITSYIFGIAAFFINLNAKKTVESKKDPYAKIYKKIDEAVVNITRAQRTIERSKLRAPLTLAQDVSEIFLSLTDERFTLQEFKYWAMTNNIPTITCFVESLSLIRSYIMMMTDELVKDGTQKELTIIYTKIAMLRDITLTAVDLLFPLKNATANADANDDADEDADEDADADADPKDYVPLQRLRKMYQQGLNRQKRRTFEFLLQYHKPTKEKLSSLSWYYPPQKDDADVKMFHNYLKGLSYVDEDESGDEYIHLMPPVTIHREILKRAIGKIIRKYSDDKIKVLRSRSAEGDIFMALDDNADFIKNVYFTFHPDNFGYTKIRYFDPDKIVDDGGNAFWKKLVEEDKNFLHFTKNIHSNGGVIHANKGKDYPENKFSMILYNSGKLERNELQFFLGREGNHAEYFNDDKFTNDKEVPRSDFYLVMENLDQVIMELKGFFADVSDGDQSAVSLGNELSKVNDNLHYCQLIGKCKRDMPVINPNCCGVIRLELEGDVKTVQGVTEGTYIRKSVAESRNVWMKEDGKYAIWYLPSGTGQAAWGVGAIRGKKRSSTLRLMGSTKGKVKTRLETCPTDDELLWSYFESKKQVVGTSIGKVKISCSE